MNNEGTLQKYLEKEKYWSSNCYCPGKVQSQDSSRPIIFITAVLWAGVSRFHCDNIFFSSSVMETRTSVSLKNSARVIPKVWHIISSWYFTYFRKFNNCYIWLSNSSQTLENTKFVASELSLTLSLVLHFPIAFHEP